MTTSNDPGHSNPEARGRALGHGLDLGFNQLDQAACGTIAAMSYDLAVWEGDRPASDELAYTAFQALCEKYVEAEEHIPPSARLTAYVEALLARWPDITDEGGEESPWASGPLIGEAVGPFMYFPIGWSGAEEASAFAADLAQAHGLVCYDPQMEQMRP